jgi:hypothetical protein
MKKIVCIASLLCVANVFSQLPPPFDQIPATPYGGTTGLFRAIVGSQQVVYYEFWGAKGNDSVVGYAVPNNEVWKVRGCGISTDDGRNLEWMLQIWIPWAGHKPNQQLLVAIQRNVGLTAGTPTLALERDVILLPGEAVAARVNGMARDRYMGIRFSAWVYPIAELPNLTKQ